MSVTSLAHINGITIWEMTQGDGEYIMGNISLSVPFSDVMNITMELLDWRGRVQSRKQIVPNINMKTAEFAFKSEDTDDFAFVVRAILVISNKLVQQYEKTVYIRKIYDPREFSLVVTDDLNMGNPDLNRYKKLRHAGVSHFVLDMTGMTDMGNIYSTVMHAERAVRVLYLELYESQVIQIVITWTGDYRAGI